MSYEVKNLKTFMGMDCPGYNATIYRDGVKVAFVIEEGNGGPLNIRWADEAAGRVDIPWFNYKDEPMTYRATKEEALMMESIRGQTWDCNGKMIQKDLDIYIGELVNEMENTKRFKRICKTKTLFRLKGDSKEEWRTFNVPFSKRLKDHMVTKYGNKIEEILNETFGQVAV